jgi:exodeoxyribonuclease III
MIRIAIHISVILRSKEAGAADRCLGFFIQQLLACLFAPLLAVQVAFLPEALNPIASSAAEVVTFCASSCFPRSLPSIYQEVMIEIASWNVNSIRARLERVTAWLKARQPDVLLLQGLKGTEFPADVFQKLGYENVAVTQKAYNGVAILSRRPMKTISTTLAGDEKDSHSRFLEVMIEGLRIVNIYLPNGNPVGSDNFNYKSAWMDRLHRQVKLWEEKDPPTLIGGDFNLIPEDIDCHKPSSWISDALFQPEPRARYRSLLKLGYIDAFRSLHPDLEGQFTFWDYFRQAFEHNHGIRIDHFLLTSSRALRARHEDPRFSLDFTYHGCPRMIGFRCLYRP